jgi:hypothetical protein
VVGRPHPATGEAQRHEQGHHAGGVATGNAASVGHPVERRALDRSSTDLATRTTAAPDSASVWPSTRAEREAGPRGRTHVGVGCGRDREAPRVRPWRSGQRVVARLEAETTGEVA